MNLYLLGTILNMSAILMTAGSGAWLSVKGGNFNLGGEGQIYTGGFVAAVTLVACKNLPAFLAIPICFVFACLASGLMAFIPALLKEYRKVDVLLSSFLISAGMIPLVDSFISGPFRGSTNNLLATEFIPQKFRFPSILPPSVMNMTFFVALLLCVALWLVFERTAFGQNLSVFGISPAFSLYTGISSRKMTFLSVTASGLLHGAAGFFIVAGTYFTCHSGFYGGMGWNAFSVALISLQNPLLIIPSAVFLAALTTGASQYSLMHNFGFDMGSMLQGFILFAIVLVPSLIKLWRKRK
ncbi:MAG: ABC transporter permease [Treponema sp.]|nr:ABC transporter permease [Treponema sp.]